MDRETVHEQDAAELARRSIRHMPEHTFSLIINGLIVAVGVMVAVGAVSFYLHAGGGL